VAVRSPEPDTTDLPEVKLKLRGIGGQIYRNPRKGHSHISESMRRVKRPLLANEYGQGVDIVPNGRRIMVTSAIPGEGKTFTAMHLALSIASEKESSVILVDGDIVKPTVSSSLGLKAQPGLTDWYESGERSAREFVVNTDFPGLRLISAGSKTVPSCELLASRATERFFAQLAKAFPNDVIVVDSPPLLVASEAKVLASQMGQVLFVVGAGISSEQQVKESIELLDPDQALSLVLNQSTQASAFKSYGY
jgi:exopolysaccharide/PEP-CTERM locus tyrosine autokinase